MSRRQICRWHPFSDALALQRAAVEFIADAALRAIGDRGVFHVVLSGGNTPRAIYEALRQRDLYWSAWRVYFGDERCVPPCSPERNSYMALKALFARVPVGTQHFHAIPAERGARAAADAYLKVMNHAGEFDLVLLGLGEDGHTASLFPGSALGDHAGAPAVLAVTSSPKPPPGRVTLSASRLSRTRHALFIVTGEEKRRAVQLWRQGADLPAAHIVPPAGVDIMLDAALLQG